MKKINCFLLNLYLIIIISFFNSCAPPSRVANQITVNSGEIPPDMEKENFTLIGILKGRKSYDKYVETAFDNYTGKYVLASEDELKTIYKDVDKYRYSMDYKMHTTKTYDPTSRGANHTGYTATIGYTYFILDRKYNKVYSRKKGSSFFALEMKAYLEAIDKVRKK